jgi:hypothetical protein
MRAKVEFQDDTPSAPTASDTLAGPMAMSGSLNAGRPRRGNGYAFTQ